MVEIWLRTDEAEDVVGSIRHALRSAKFVSDDVYAWKWVAIALHSALQGACVCHLTTTAAPIGAVTKRSAEEWKSYFDASITNPDATLPETFLKSFPDLLKAVRKPQSAGDGSNAVGVAISDSELNWLRRFHEDIRNQFVHFRPAGWSVEVSGLPEIAKLASRIITEILNIGWAFRHLDDAQLKELERGLQSLVTLTGPP